MMATGTLFKDFKNGNLLFASSSTNVADPVTKQGTKKQQSPRSSSTKKWHSSGFGFHKKSTVSAAATNQGEIPALRPPKNSRNAPQLSFHRSKKENIEHNGAPKPVGSPLYQPVAGSLSDFS
jgi:hypothetical protein